MAQRKVTAQDVAIHAGVSRTTVSYVLNDVKTANISEETRQRVLASARELGYVPDAAAQALASGRAYTVGLITLPPRGDHPSGLTLAPFVEGLLEITRKFGVRLLIDSATPSDTANTLLNLVQTKSIDGLIIPAVLMDNPTLYTFVKDQLPVVLMGHLPGFTLTCVDFDNRGGARAAVTHLITQGHTRIGLVAHMPSLFVGAGERLQGYKDALAAAGIVFDEALVRYVDFNPDSAIAATKSLLEVPEKPSAFFVTNDAHAFAALATIRDRGMTIPDEIAVVGFDDHPLARYASPPLTTVRFSLEELGRQAGLLLFDLILQKAKPGRQVRLETELVVRASSVRAP